MAESYGQINMLFFIKYLKRCNRNNELGVRHKSFNSSEWMKRHKTDPYVEKAKRENYRCRSSFKLIEIDDKYKLIEAGFNVLDVGAAPGSWSQVLANRTNSNGNDPKSPKGLVISIDLSYIYPVEGVVTLSNMDFTKETSQEKILEVLGERKLDFVFSDMAPAATGIRALDKHNIASLVFPVLVFSIKNLKLGGGCLMKIWAGHHEKLEYEMKRFFKFFKYVKPNAVYNSSSELYLLGKDFVGVKK